MAIGVTPPMINGPSYLIHCARGWTAREDGRRASEDCSAIAEEKPAALGKRWRVARHEA